MPTAYVVIGAGYGDEGKGLITDHLTRHLGTEVVTRFNGGAQAGHTVVAPNGTRHVFSHVGAGTLAGAATYLSGWFIVNPYLLERELGQLKTKGIDPTIYASELARVTTIYDMALNAAAELARGSGRHGSCGLGINETATRGDAGFELTLDSVVRLSRRGLERVLERIHLEYVPERLKQLGIGVLPDSFHLQTGEVLRNGNYAEHAARLLYGAHELSIVDRIELADEIALRPVILEGAQGLAIDEELGEFPHVTRSKTGLPYALPAAADLYARQLRPIYVTRAYATRHGAGPLPGEGEIITERDLIDQTNVNNEWQGALRYAPLDLARLKRDINADMERGLDLATGYGIEIVDPVLAVTCLDQLGPHVTLFDLDGTKVIVPHRDVTTLIEDRLGYKVALTGFGPTSLNVVQLAEFGV